MQLGKLGVWTWLDAFSTEEAAAFAARVEAWGYAALWVPEAVGREPFSLLGYLAAKTRSLVLATGIANIYARDAMTMRATRETLGESSQGRFLLGLGVSHAHLVAGVRKQTGVAIQPGGAGGMRVQVCMTKEMVERDQIPAQGGQCKTQVSPRSGNTMKFSYACTQPPSSGEGVMTFNGDTGYTMKMNTTTTVKGKPEKMTMDASGKWLSADCGNIKPITPPKK